MVFLTSHKDNKIRSTLQLFFILLHVATALEFGFLKLKSIRAKIAVKLFTCLQCLGICAFTLYELIKYEKDKEFAVVDLWLIIILPHYVYNCMILLFNYDKSFYFLLKKFIYIDAKLGIENGEIRTNVFILLSCILCAFARIVISLVNCLYYTSQCSQPMLINSMVTAHLVLADIILLMTYFFLCNVYCRLKKLTSIVLTSAEIVPNYIMIYKSIADNLDKFKGPFDYLYLMALALKVPESITTVYYILENHKNDENTYFDEQLVRGGYTGQVLVLLFLPAICAGRLTAKANELKLLLHEKLIFQRDEVRASVIERFIDCVSSQPLRLRMIKIVPLDWTLPLLVLNLIISYQIIIVQFTHLY